MTDIRKAGHITTLQRVTGKKQAKTESKSSKRVLPKDISNIDIETLEKLVKSEIKKFDLADENELKNARRYFIGKALEWEFGNYSSSILELAVLTDKVLAKIERSTEATEKISKIIKGISAQ